MRPVGSLQCVMQLLNFRADPAAVTAEGQTARNLAARYNEVTHVLQEALQLSISRDDSRRYPNAQLVDAARRGNCERVRLLLEQLADPDSSDGTMSALSRACLERHTDVASQLLLARAQVDMCRRLASLKVDEDCALHYAARSGPVKTVTILLSSSADRPACA